MRIRSASIRHDHALGPGRINAAAGQRGAAADPDIDWAVTSPWLQRPIGVAAMFDAKDDHFVEIFTDAVQNAVGPPPGRPHSRQVIAQWLSRPVWLVDQRRGQELDHRCGDWFGQLPCQGAARGRGKD
jgi:hypothetical protein